MADDRAAVAQGARSEGKYGGAAEREQSETRLLLALEGSIPQVSGCGWATDRLNPEVVGCAR